jgi:hypothetical protein
VASSSALITGQGNYSTHGNQNKIIIPVFQSIRSNIYKALNQMDPSVSINAGINALGGANMGVFEADTPFALFYGLSKNDENVKLLFAQNTTYDKEVINVVFFMIPSSFAPKWEIINYADYLNGFDGRIKTMINNFVYRLDWETEPYLLNPNFYLEQYKMGDTDLNIDLSLIDYYVPNFSEIDTKGFSLYGYHVFNNNLEIIYDFNDYNNDENPI